MNDKELAPDTIDRGSILVTKVSSLPLAKVAKQKLVAFLLLRGNVREIGILKTNKSYALKVNLSSDVGVDTIPEQINGFPIWIEIIE